MALLFSVCLLEVTVFQSQTELAIGTINRLVVTREYPKTQFDFVFDLEVSPYLRCCFQYAYLRWQYFSISD